MNGVFRASDCVRIFDPVPQDEFVVEREEVIKELRSRLLRRRSVPQLMVTLSGLCEVFCGASSIPGEVAVQVEDAFRKIDGAFPRSGRNLELGVCGIAAVNQAITSGRGADKWDGWSAPDVIAGCVWSALSFLPSCQERKLDALRRCTIGIARQRFCATGLSARVRYDVPAAKELDRRSSSRGAYTAAVDAIGQLQINAILDREEIDVLRWVLDGRSSIHNKPLRLLSSVSRVITAGVEIGALTQAPPTKFHRSRLVFGDPENLSVSLSELLDTLGGERFNVAESLMDRSVICKSPLVFPMLSAICSGDATQPGADVARPLSEWGSRALLERILVDIKL